MEHWTREKLVQEYRSLPSDKLLLNVTHDLMNLVNGANGLVDFLVEDLEAGEHLDIAKCRYEAMEIRKYIKAAWEVLQAASECE
jgi:hypothetical protein